MKFKKYSFLRLIIAIIVLAAFFALCSGSEDLYFIADWQLVPALLRVISTAALGSMATLLILILIAVIGGRWYCSLWCPVGIFTDLIDLIPFPGKGAVKKDLPFLRLFMLILVLCLTLTELNAGFLLFDPYSNFTQTAGELFRKNFTSGMLITLATFIALALWKRRFYCTFICPVGAVLNLLSRKPVLKLVIKDNCVKCKVCEKSCPAGCIDIEKTSIDNGRCIRCLACLDACKFSALTFGTKTAVPAKKTDISRREFLKRGSAALGGAVAGGVMLKLGMEKFSPALPFSKILPPGAGDLDRFASKCTSCLICVQNCPHEIIRPAINGDGPVSLDLRSSFCDWECNMCSAICPTGALEELNLTEKQHTQIALAQISKNCIGCTKCVETCPARAISMRSNRAEVDSNSCVGCGECAQACPVKAIQITPIPVQKPLPERAVEKSPASDQTKKAFIDAKVCFSCGSCAEVCPTKAITLDENDTPKPVDQAKCIGCGKCITTCPARAISLK